MKRAEEGEKGQLEGLDVAVTREEELLARRRQKWHSQVHYILSLMGWAIGLGNLWRFPYLCFKNGGGAFMIPYVIFMFTCGAPLFFLESSFGQFTQNGVLKAWNLVPAFKGVGIATTFALLYLNVYYVVILAWIIYYMFESIQSPLPFATCDNSWNTEDCYTVQDMGQTSTGNLSLSVEEFWERKVLQTQFSSGIEDVGSVVPHLALALLAVWFGCYFTVFRGIKISGRVVYFTVLFPYILILCIIIRGLTLPGSLQGIEFYLKPDLTRLSEAQVWIDAASQIFFSYAVCCGGLITMSSYNHFNNNVLRDSMVVIVANPCTSVLAGFGVFSVLGHLSHKSGIPVESITDSGPGLVFKTYPVAVSLLPLPNLWAILFFLMAFLLGVDGQYAAVEAFVCSIMDLWPRLRKDAVTQALFTLVVCALKFLVGLSMATEGGIYVFNLFDCYAANGIIYLTIGLSQIVPLMYVYGFNKYKEDIFAMLGFRSLIVEWFNFCWTFISPFIITSILAFAVYQKATSSTQFVYEDYVYPTWSQVVGWLFITLSLMWIPLYMLYHVVKSMMCPSATNGSEVLPESCKQPCANQENLLSKC